MHLTISLQEEWGLRLAEAIKRSDKDAVRLLLRDEADHLTETLLNSRESMRWDGLTEGEYNALLKELDEDDAPADLNTERIFSKKNIYAEEI